MHIDLKNMNQNIIQVSPEKNTLCVFIKKFTNISFWLNNFQQ